MVKARATTTTTYSYTDRHYLRLFLDSVLFFCSNLRHNLMNEKRQQLGQTRDKTKQ